MTRLGQLVKKAISLNEPTPLEDRQIARRELMELAEAIDRDNLELQASESNTDDDSRDKPPHVLRSALGEEAASKLELLPLPVDFLLTVVIPVYNEHTTVEEVVERVLRTGLPIELLIVDDGSTDGTRAVLEKIKANPPLGVGHQRSEITVHFHPQNAGKGAALRTGFGLAKGNVVVIQDADTEYDPEDFFRMLPAILNDEADVVYGSRYQQESISSSPGWHRFGNQLITKTSNLKTGQRFTDVETCYKMFRREILSQISSTLRERGFGIELEMTAKLAKLKGIRFTEVPIRYEKRTYAEGKKIGIKDAFWAFWCIMRY